MRKKTNKRAKVRANPAEKAGDAYDDPLEVIGAIPRGISYQWMAETVFGEPSPRTLSKFKGRGWSPVPPAQHPQMPRRGKRIEFGGLVLYQRKTKLHNAARKEELDKAKFIVDCAQERVTTLEPQTNAINLFNRWEEPKKPLEVSAGYFSVEIQVQLSDRQIDAAGICGLSLPEYAKAMVYMMRNMANTGTVVLVPLDTIQGGFKLGELCFKDVN